MHISNFRPVKRVPDIVRAFAGIRERVPSVLILVGDGPVRPDVEAEVLRLGVGSSVRFLGKVDAVADLLRAADLYLLPSQSESFGLSALEAMACGVPVIGTRVGGLPEVVRDGQDGVLVDVGDVDGIVRAALELLEPARWREARRAAIARAGDFSAERVVPLYERLYERVARG
jgi:N-acetyl-alpha-D-glucosaminyl L-malate synthase BshA